MIRCLMFIRSEIIFFYKLDKSLGERIDIRKKKVDGRKKKRYKIYFLVVIRLVVVVISLFCSLLNENEYHIQRISFRVNEKNTMNE